MKSQVTASASAAAEQTLARVLARHARVVDAATRGDDLIADKQRAAIRGLMISLFRAAAGYRAKQYGSYSELPRHSDGPILGRATLGRHRFVRIAVRKEEQGFMT